MCLKHDQSIQLFAQFERDDVVRLRDDHDTQTSAAGRGMPPTLDHRQHHGFMVPDLLVHVVENPQCKRVVLLLQGVELGLHFIRIKRLMEPVFRQVNVHIQGVPRRGPYLHPVEFLVHHLAFLGDQIDQKRSLSRPGRTDQTHEEIVPRQRFDHRRVVVAFHGHGPNGAGGVGDFLDQHLLV